MISQGSAFPKAQGVRSSTSTACGIPSHPIFITEGVTDCLAVLSAGFNAIAIPSATLLSENDKQKLSFLASTKTFHIYPDADEPGERLFLQLSVILPKLVRHRLPEGFKDIGQYYAHIKR